MTIKDSLVTENAADNFEDGTRMKELADSGTVKIGVKYDQPGLGFLEPGADAPAEPVEEPLPPDAAARLDVLAQPLLADRRRALDEAVLIEADLVVAIAVVEHGALGGEAEHRKVLPIQVRDHDVRAR